MTQVDKLPPNQSGNEQRTLKQVFDEVFDSLQGNDAARSAITALQESYDDEKLAIIFDTQREVAELREEIESAAANDGKIDDIEKSGIDANIDRERIEDTIKSKVEGIETVSDLRELSFDKLIELEGKYEGILFYAFTDFVDSGSKLNFDNYYSWYKAPKDGDSFEINFYGNQEANQRLGAGDIMPPTVRGVTVYPGGSKDDSDPEKRISTRRLGLKGDGDHANSGFFDDRGYIAIYTGYMVTVGGVDMSFDEKYRGPVSADGRLGELKYDAYAQDHDEVDSLFVAQLPRGARTSKYHGGASVDRAFRRKHDLNKKLPDRNIRKILDKVPDLHRYTGAAREKYRTQTGIDIPENIMYGIARVESSFNVCAANPKSSAKGLYQFLGSTWNGFLAANPWVYEKMNKDSAWKDVDQMDWRFNPEIMTYAAYWLATHDLTYLYKHKGEARYSKFDRSAFARSSGPSTANPLKLSENDTWILYLTHHDGAGGALSRMKFLGDRERGTSEAVAARRAGLASWQGYSEGKVKADKDAKSIIGIADRAMKSAKDYGQELNGYTVPSGSGNWGWGGEAALATTTSASPSVEEPVIAATTVDAPTPKPVASTVVRKAPVRTEPAAPASYIPKPVPKPSVATAPPPPQHEVTHPESTTPAFVAYYKDTGNLEAISGRPVMKGKTLYVGSSSTVGYTMNLGDEQPPLRIAESGRSITWMQRQVAQTETSDLRSCDRVILQGGIKNILGSGLRTPAQKADAMDQSVAAMKAMVADIRSRAPGVAIYVQEIVPWTKANTQLVRDYNGWLNSGELDVDGVIPIYQVMSDVDGLWDERFGSSNSGDTLHCRKPKWFAGIVADWVDKKESDELNRTDGSVVV